MAEPRTAQAMGPMIEAMGHRTSLLERKGDLEAKKALYDAKGDEAMWKGIGDVANTVMQSTDQIDRILERRAEREASSALTQYQSDMNMATAGYTDKDGNRVPGTFETPYNPGNEKDEATGPTMATARAEKDWLNRDESPYSKLSPRAKRLFDERVGRIHSHLMVNAGKIEFDMIRVRRQQEQEAALQTKRDTNVQINGRATDPNAVKLAAVSIEDFVEEQLRTEFSTMRKDEWGKKPITDAEWVDPSVAAAVKDRADILRTTFYTDAIHTLLANAAVEEDDARRQALLATALAYSEQTGPDGDPLYADTIKADFKLKTIQINDAALRRHEQKNQYNYQKAMELVVYGANDPEKYDDKAITQLLDALPPAMRKRAYEEKDAFLHMNQVANEKGEWAAFRKAIRAEDIFADVVMGKSRVRDQAKSLISTFRTPEAIQYAKDTMLTDAHPQAEAEFQRMLEIRAVYVNGQRYDLNDEQLTTMLAQGSGILYSPEKITFFRKIITGSKTQPQVADRIFTHLEAKLGTDQVSEALSFNKDLQRFVPNTKWMETSANAQAQARARGMSIPTDKQVASYRIAGTITKDGETETYRETIRLTQDLVAEIVQAAYEYEMAPKVRDKDGNPPMPLEQFIDNMLTPQNGNTAERLNNATIRHRISQMYRLKSEMERRFQDQAFNWLEE